MLGVVIVITRPGRRKNLATSLFVVQSVCWVQLSHWKFSHGDCVVLHSPENWF